MRQTLLMLTVAATLLHVGAMPSFVGVAFAQQAPAQTDAADTVFSRAELEALLKPIALYPDPLLAQMLPASAYPLDIVHAARWLDRNKAAVARGDFSAADTMPWDPSIKALIRFPEIIQKMNEYLDWTSDLGDAFVNQPQDVANTIQDLRALAAKGGALKSTPQQTVVRRTEGTREIIVIEPASPEVIFVPSYDPAVVFAPVGSAVAAGLLTFGTAVAVGAIINNNYWNWSSGVVFPPRWPGYPGFRPGVGVGVGSINIGNEINIGSGNNLIGSSRPWRPDPNRYRPGQGSKPGLARPGGPGWAGSVAGPGGIGGPGGVGGVGGPGRPGGAGGPGGIGGPGGAGGALGGAAAGAIGGAAAGAIAGRPGGQPGRPDARPGVPDRPQAGPGAGRPERPQAGAGTGRPQTRPATPSRPQAGTGGAQARPGGGAAQPRPGGGAAQPRPGGGAAQARPGGGAAQPRPGGGAAQARPGGGAVQPRPGGGAVQARPQPRPQTRPTALDHVGAGPGAAALGNRGAASRGSVGGGGRGGRR
jgi:hypothetical protein